MTPSRPPRIYTREEARAAQLEFAGDQLMFFGWLWRAPTHNVHGWHFTHTATASGRSYPTDAEFIPVLTIEGDE